MFVLEHLGLTVETKPTEKKDGKKKEKKGVSRGEES